jgi:hypothetical protein
MPHRLTAALVASAAVLVSAPGASAATTPGLWTTVNRCDGPKSPDEMGVRAQMPGNGTRQRMYVRFRAQWWDVQQERFRYLRGSGARSPWIYAGSARYDKHQAGWTFRIRVPAFTGFTLRGVADFRWRAKKRRTRRWVVVRRAMRVTKAGFAGVKGGDPPTLSEALCWIH